MDEKKDTRQETDEERARRLRRQRRIRQEMRRRRRRRALILRGVLAVAGILIVVLLIWGISALAGKIGGGEKKTADGEKTEQTGQTETAEEEELEEVAAEKVLHLSFGSLIADTEAAFGQEDRQAALSMDQGHLTVDEFNQVLQQLYDQGYILVGLHDLAVWDEESGQMQAQTLRLPSGKKPLLLSQANVNYDLSLTGQGCASAIVLDDSGKIQARLDKADGTSQTGDYDVIPCVDTFVEAHPDFSYNGARGVLSFSGYNGVLGYRTDESLGSTENNKYASKYGVFDTASETEAAKPVIEALRAEGWEFASGGYGNISYAQDLETIQSDMELWQTRVKPLLGDVDILMFPEGTDIGDRKEYGEDNEKYQYLKEQGFRYFCSRDLGEPFTQITWEYARSGYWNLDGYRMYQDLYQDAGRFSGILDFSQLYDPERPSVSDESGAEEEAGTEEGTEASEEETQAA